MRLFAVMLGGTAPRASTELHDVVFACGERIEDTWDQLLDAWFGAPRGLHVDSWAVLDAVDGWRIVLRPEPAAAGTKLWFVNLGAYRPDHFGELHAVTFLAGEDAAGVKARAKARLLRDAEQQHTDDLHDVDECLAVTRVGGLHVHLEPAGEATDAAPEIVNGWLPLPEAVVAAWEARR